MKISDKKSSKFHSSHREKNKRTTRPQGWKLNMNHVARKNINEAKLQKAFRIKLFEFCKTTTKKSSPDLSNFYVTSAGHDMAMTVAGLPRAGSISKPHDYKQNVQKVEGLLKKWVSTRKQFEIFKPKKTKKSSHRIENKTKEPRDPKGKNWTWTM